MLIPVKASFSNNGKPAVYVQKALGFSLRPIEVGKRNENDIVVRKGLEEGDVVTLENPTRPQGEQEAVNSVTGCEVRRLARVCSV